MAIDKKYSQSYTRMLADTRSIYVRVGDWFAKPDNFLMVCVVLVSLIFLVPQMVYFLDIIFIVMFISYIAIMRLGFDLPFKLPMSLYHKIKDKNNEGGGHSGKSEGILFMGNDKKTNEEVWFTNSDIRTHILYLGTTGSGKTEGLKSMVTNALCWASGFVYIDGKADTDLWSNLSSLVRRFGRDDDLFVLNYMTGNSDTKAPSNTMNPFSVGSAGYLTNMLVSLMPDAEGDNAMWKERAVSLIGSIMPILTWKRDNQDVPMSVSSIRRSLDLDAIIKLSRDKAVPEKLTDSLKGYLRTLPGFVDAAFDDDGQEKPAGPDVPMVDTQVVRQQHGYLSMQFTRSLQSLGDDYGYIFDAPHADIDMVDIVLNRRILIVLIPALEKSSDEIANLGKIVSATLKGMMGSTLGSTVEGSAAAIIENKPTHSITPFMSVFDEVGYYVASGMGVMAAQARSLGFSLVFSAQDLPALEKRVKEEARSIAGNCNIKIFGKLEDPTQTQEFFKNSVPDIIVAEASNFNLEAGSLTGGYSDARNASIQFRKKASYDGLKYFKEGESVIMFGPEAVEMRGLYTNPGFARAMRVQKLIPLPAPQDADLRKIPGITALRDRMVSKNWTAMNAESKHEISPELEALEQGFVMARGQQLDMADSAAMAVIHSYVKTDNIDLDDIEAVPEKKEQVSSPVKEKTAVKVGPDGEEIKEKSESWDDLVGEDDEEGEEGRTGGAGDARKLKMAQAGQYSAEAAVEALAQNGEYQLPEGLNDDVMNILMGAADNIREGLFGEPKLAQEQEKKSGMPTAKNINPKGR
ncbi:MAG: type IV secretion protein IcmO [Micavibrio sp.]|nr:type IV secretion protein IcmO [Micavibrio sp.]